MIFMFILAHTSIGGERFKSSKCYTIFSAMGTLSYGIYGWHGYLIKYIHSLSSSFFGLNFASIVIAYLSHRIMESPLLRFKREKNHSPIDTEIK